MLATNRPTAIAVPPNELAQYIQEQADSKTALPTSLFKAFVPCSIQVIERIGVSKRGGTPYLVYRTQFGRCCTFLSKAGFLQSLSTLLSINEHQPVDAKAMRVGEWGGVYVTTTNGERYIPRAELFAFLIRLNQVGLDRLQVKLEIEGAMVHNQKQGTTYRISASECGCNDILYRHLSCKHQIAAAIYLQVDGWGSLKQYLGVARPLVLNNC